MTRDKIYRRPNLTLRALSDHTTVSENHVSQALNEHLGKNFYEFINHWRIKDAMQLLQETEFSVIQVGDEVGFNSRSTFNAAFKKETGVTPSEFRSTGYADKEH
ncbi:MAG: helix-turn-helix transcriptional regulator [Beijerinckiaceae bacterium]